MSEAKDGDTIKTHYTGTLADGEVFDSSRGRDPLEFTLGNGQLIVGFEKAVRGRSEGETVTTNIPAAEAYGVVNEDLVFTVARSQFPDSMELAVGRALKLSDGQGSSHRAVVTEIGDENVKLDGNHPLAGKDLTFEIELVSVVSA
jgi:peptidylprolyl isomerase